MAWNNAEQLTFLPTPPDRYSPRGREALCRETEQIRIAPPASSAAENKIVTSLMARTLPYVITAMCTVIIGLIAGLGYFVQEKNDRLLGIEDSLHKVEQEIAVMRGNRFTSEHGKEVWQEIAKIRQDMAELELSVPKVVPPKWFEDKVDGIGSAVSKNSDKLDTIEATVIRMESHIITVAQ